MAMNKITSRITNDELEKFRLNFSRLANHTVAALIISYVLQQVRNVYNKDLCFFFSLKYGVCALRLNISQRKKMVVKSYN